MSRVAWPDASAPDENCAVIPAGRFATASAVSVLNPFVPVRPTEKEPWPKAGIVSGVGKADAVKSAATRVKLCALVAVPCGVATETRPLAEPVGTVTTREVPALLTDEAITGIPPIVTWLLANVGLKFPVSVTTVPIDPLVGEKLVILGGPGDTVTVLVAFVPFSEAVMSACPSPTAVTVMGALS